MGASDRQQARECGCGVSPIYTEPGGIPCYLCRACHRWWSIASERAGQAVARGAELADVYAGAPPAKPVLDAPAPGPTGPSTPIEVAKIDAAMAHGWAAGRASVIAEAVLADAVRTSTPLPTDSAERKRTPLCTGCLDYFPAAFEAIVAAIASYRGIAYAEGDERAADPIWSLSHRGEAGTTARLAIAALAILQDELNPDAHRDWREVHTMSDLFDMFPAALAAVAQVSWHGNEKHNPGQPLHHARGKSTDHADTIARHYVERGGFDGPMRHTACLAWRCLALLQQELEDAGAPLARGARL